MKDSNTLNFAIQNAGPSSSAAAWCALDSLHGGTTVASGTTATIAVNGSASVTTSALPIGYYDLYVAPSTGGCQGTGFVAASLAVILDNTTTADPRFGINMLAGVNSGTKYIGFVQQVATAMRTIGFGGTRDQITWKDLESTYGAYSWPTAQPAPPCTSSMAGVTGFVCVFNNYYSNFSNNLLTAGYGNTNYTGGNTTPPSGATPIAGFDNYVAALVAPLSSYPGKINPSYLSAIGVWNEFSNDQFCTGCSSTISTRGTAYNSIVTTVRSSAGGKTLIGGAATGLGLPWWVGGQPVTATPSPVDALDIHPYEAVADALQLDLTNFATYVNGAGGLGQKAVWASEYGAILQYANASNQSYLAGYPAKASAIMLTNGLTDIFWYAAAQTPNASATTGSLLLADSKYNNYFMSPSTVGFNTVIRTLSGFAPDTTYDHMAGTGDKRVHVYHFTKGVKNAYVIWMSSGSATVSFASGSPTAVDAVGKSVALPAPLSNDLPILVSSASTLSSPIISTTDVYMASSIDDFALDICSGSICTTGGTEPGASSLNNWQYGVVGSGGFSTSTMLWSSSFNDYYWSVSGGAQTKPYSQSPGTNPVGRAWIAPTSYSDVYINGSFSDGSAVSATGTSVAIFKNGTMIWPSSGWLSLGIGGYTSFSVYVGAVSSGDKLIFETECNGTCTNDHGGVAAYISHTKP